MDDYGDHPSNGDEEFEASEDDHKFRTQLGTLIEDLEEDLQDLGLKVKLASTATPTEVFDPEAEEIDNSMDLRMCHSTGTLSIFVRGIAEINETVAFSDRVLLPAEEHEVNQAVRASLPTEEELALEAMLESLNNRNEEDEL